MSDFNKTGNKTSIIPSTQKDTTKDDEEYAAAVKRLEDIINKPSLRIFATREQLSTETRWCIVVLVPFCIAFGACLMALSYDVMPIQDLQSLFTPIAIFEAFFVLGYCYYLKPFENPKYLLHLFLAFLAGWIAYEFFSFIGLFGH